MTVVQSCCTWLISAQASITLLSLVQARRAISERVFSPRVVVSFLDNCEQCSHSQFNAALGKVAETHAITISYLGGLQHSQRHHGQVHSGDGLLRVGTAAGYGNVPWDKNRVNLRASKAGNAA